MAEEALITAEKLIKCFVGWHDNRAVTLASSYLGPEQTDFARR